MAKLKPTKIEMPQTMELSANISDYVTSAKEEMKKINNTLTKNKTVKVKYYCDYLPENKKDPLYSQAVDMVPQYNEEMQFDAMARLREVYPNIMKMDYDNTSTRAIQESDAEIQTEGKSFDELVSDFYKIINGTEPSEKEWNIIYEVAKEAGVIQ